MTMSTSLLVRTPKQVPGESPLGFVLRLSEANGYETPRRVFSLARATRDEMFCAGLNMTKIAAVLRFSPEQLEGYRPHNETDLTRVQCNGHALSPEDISLTDAKICPECIQELGHVPSWVDLDIVDACPKHERQLVTHCPTCGNRLSWFRPGLLQCKCGARLHNARGRPIGEEQVALLSHVVAKVQGEPAPRLCGMPTDQFEQMPLRGFLAMVRGLVRLERHAAVDLGAHSPAARAGWMFSRWPENLFSVFATLVPKDAAENGVVVLRRHLEGVYRVIWKTISSASDIAFLRAAVVEFSQALQTRKDFEPVSLTGAGLGAQQATENVKGTDASDNKGATPLPHETRGMDTSSRKKRIVIRRKNAPHPIGQRALSIRKAANRVNLPVTVLEYLRRAGHFEVRHKTLYAKSFHEADVVAFEVKISVIRAAVAPTGSPTLSFGEVMHRKFKFADGKGEFVAAIFDGKLACFSSGEPGFQGLLFDTEEVLALLAAQRAAAFGDALTIAETSKVLCCDPLAVPDVIAKGYLQSFRDAAGIRIPRDSVVKFETEYWSLARLANELGTSSVALHRQVSVFGLELVYFQRTHSKGQQPFLKKSEIARCKELWKPVSRKTRLPAG